MALPKKRKKLDTAAENTAPAETRGSTAPKSRTRKSAKSSSAAGSNRSEKMSKAFEIMEKMEGPDHVKTETPPAKGQALQAPYAEPGGKTTERIRFRISLDRKGRGGTDNRIDTGRAREIDFGIAIPSIIWKIPVLKKAAEKILQRLSKDES